MNDNPFQDDINAQGLGAEPISEPSTSEGPYVIDTPKEETPEEEAPIDPEMSRRMDEVLNSTTEPDTTGEPIVRGVEIPVNQPVNNEPVAAEPMAPVEPAVSAGPETLAEAPVEPAATTESFDNTTAPADGSFDATAEAPVEPVSTENESTAPVASAPAETPVANNVTTAPKKKSSPVVMIILIVVLLLAIGGVVAAFAMNGGFGGNSGGGSSSSSNKEDTPTPVPVKQAYGTAKQGYISLPDGWTEYDATSDKDSILIYNSADSTRMVKMESFDAGEGGSAKAIADEEYMIATVTEGYSQPQMASKTVNSYEGYTVYYYEESMGIWRFMTIFVDGNSMAHIVTISTPDETDELLTSVIDSWRLGISSDSSSESAAAIEEVVEKNQEVSTQSSAVELEVEPEE